MYKDKDKQRAAIKKATQRYRAKNEHSVLSAENWVSQNAPESSVVDEVSDTQPVIPEHTAQGNIKVSKPGDADYVPQCETTRAFIEGRDKRPEAGKRGKDIKAFEDLPPDIQQTIDTLSDDKTEHKRRTAIAINYQHQFPDRYHSTGCDVFKRRQGKPGVI